MCIAPPPPSLLGVCPDGCVVCGIATNCYLSLTTVRVQIPPRACEKVANDLRLVGGFRRVLQFPLPVTTGLSRINRNMAEKVTKNQEPHAFLPFRRSVCCPPPPSPSPFFPPHPYPPAHEVKWWIYAHLLCPVYFGRLTDVCWPFTSSAIDRCSDFGTVYVLLQGQMDERRMALGCKFVFCKNQ